MVIRAIAALSIVLHFACFSAQAAGAKSLQLSQASKLDDGCQVVYEVFPGVSKWRLFPNLWVYKKITVSWAKGRVNLLSCILPACPRSE